MANLDSELFTYLKCSQSPWVIRLAWRRHRIGEAVQPVGGELELVRSRMVRLPHDLSIRAFVG